VLGFSSFLSSNEERSSEYSVGLMARIAGC
jgi:hypothetical protein